MIRLTRGLLVAGLLAGLPGMLRSGGHPPESLAGRNLVTADAPWEFTSDTAALRRVVAADGSDQIAFFAAAIPEHLEDRDTVVLPCDLGTRPFDLTVDVVIDRCTGPSVFSPGLAVGLAPEHPDAMDAEALAVMMTFHFGGLYAGVRKGPPYALRAGTADVLVPSVTHLVGGSPVPAESYSREVRGTFSTGHPVRLRIRRDAAHVLHFAAWSPAAGQTAAEPWWEATWAIPEAHAAMPLRTLFLKRIPVFSVHLGQGNKGYGDAIQLAGRLTAMTLRLDPPAITEVGWDDAVLLPGGTVVIQGSGFEAGATVMIGGLPAAIVHRTSDRMLGVRVPELAAGHRYGVAVTNPNATDSEMPGAVPVGHLLDSLSLVDGLPAGGDSVTLTGSGFRGGEHPTVVHFGAVQAVVTDCLDPRTLRVTVPAGTPGTVRVTAATAGGDPFAGELPFGYTERPSLFFDAAGRDALRDRSQAAPLARYRESLLRAAGPALERAPYSPHVPMAPYLAGLPWVDSLSGEPPPREALLAWVRAVLSRAGSNREEGAFLAHAYDLAGADMPIDLRQRLLARLQSVLDAYRAAEASGDWHITNASWTNPQANAAAIKMALVVRHARADSEAVLDAASGHLWHYIERGIGPDGGCIDGLSWGTGALADFLEAAYLLARHRGDRTLLDHPRLERMDRLYAATILTPDRLVRFGDMHDRLSGIVPAAALGSRTDDPLLLWVSDTIAGRAGWDSAGRVGLSMLLRSPAPLHEAPPPLPTVAALQDMHWGVMRSHPAADATFAVGVSGRDGVMPYHRQHDVAGFQFYAHGEELVLDPGWGSGLPEEHSIPEIDGISGDAWGGRITDTLTLDPWRVMVVDATRNRAPFGIRRFRRTLALHTGGTLVMLDDIVPAPGSPGAVRSRIQVPRAELESGSDRIARVPGEQAELAIRFFGPDTRLSTEARRRGRHWTGEWESLCAAYTAEPARPLVTVLRAGRVGVSAPSAAMVAFADGELSVTVTPEAVLQFRHTAEGWALVRPDGDGRQVLLMSDRVVSRPEAICVRAGTPPVLDGVLDDPVWRAAPPASGFVELHTWRDPPAARLDTEVRFAYDDQHLYAAFRCFESALEELVIAAQGPALGAGGDHVILYLDPERERTVNRFYGVVLTAAGRHLGFYGKSGDIGGYSLTAVAGRELAGPDGPGAWTLEVAWPWEVLLHDPWERLTLAGPPSSGHRMGLNMQRFRIPSPGEISVWAPGFDAPAATPWRWGELRFE